MPVIIKKGQQLKEAAIAQVLHHEPEEWKQKVLAEVRKFCKQRSTFLAEDVRLFLQSTGFPKPHHHNVWGALWNLVKRKGWVEMTPDWRASTALRAHARIQPIWRSTLYEKKK